VIWQIANEGGTLDVNVSDTSEQHVPACVFVFTESVAAGTLSTTEQHQSEKKSMIQEQLRLLSQIKLGACQSEIPPLHTAVNRHPNTRSG